MRKNHHQLTFEVYKDKQGQFRWRCSRHGKILCESSEAYKNRSTMKKVLRHILGSINESNYTIKQNGTPVCLWG